MRYADFLKEQGTIGCLAPSFGCNIEPYRSAFQNAQKKWKALGYQVELGPNCYAGEGVGISNRPELCGQEVNDSFVSKTSDVLISCGGGELMCEDLPYIDFEKIRELPAKWYLGYSDNTNLTFLLPTLCDTAAIYGPCAPAFGMEPWHESIQMTMEILEGKRTTVQGFELWEKESTKDEEHPLEPYHVTEKSVSYLSLDGKTYSNEGEVQMQGRLLGGCLDVLSGLVGTKFDQVKAFQKKYSEDGILWFLESCDLNVFSIRRALWQLDQAGWFANAKGFLIGRPMHFQEDMMGLDQYEAVLGILGKYQKPILMDLDIGHLAPMMPIVEGAIGKASWKNQKMSLQMDYQ